MSQRSFMIFNSLTCLLLLCAMTIVIQPGSLEAQPSTYREVQATVTAYCPGPCCCGLSADGITSTSTDARTFGFAVDPKLIPYGSIIEIPALGLSGPADDTGGALRKAGKLGKYAIDIRMQDHEMAKKFGRRWLPVRIHNN